VNNAILSRAELLGDIFERLIRIGINEHTISECSKGGVTQSQFEALLFIKRHRNCTVGDLAHGLRISYPSATNIASRLFRKNLVIKKAPRSDRRIVKLSLSEEAEKIVEIVRNNRLEKLNQILTAMHPIDRERLDNCLNKFIAAASSSGVVEFEEACVGCGTDARPDCPILNAETTNTCR
jgi:DNA-binding MarR family transcriptional regulator